VSRERRRQRYASRVEAAAARALRDGRIQPGSFNLVAVCHDDWCRLLEGKGPCNCNPEVRMPRTVTREEWIQAVLDAAAGKEAVGG
jgi:hypothetical protein